MENKLKDQSFLSDYVPKGIKIEGISNPDKIRVFDEKTKKAFEDFKNENPELFERQNEIKQPEGKKLYLEVEVKDKDDSLLLYQ